MKTFSNLYDAYITSIMNYGTGIGFLKNYAPTLFRIESPDHLHQYASNVAIQDDVGWKWPVVRRTVEMVKLLRMIIAMPKGLTKNILIWDWGHKGRN